ncbi:hypothetical protein SNE40_019220 [Patella caerulea]
MNLMHTFVLLLLVEFSLQDYPFKDTSLSWDVRVNDLVGRLTVDEMAMQMARGGQGENGPAPAISRLGIGPYQWDTECLHGAVWHKATAFPQAIGIAATWSHDEVYRLAEVSGEEVRAFHNDAVKHNKYDSITGASCYAPVINIMRDPRWGRNQETYGEDPYLSGMLATAFVHGLQGNHSRYVRATAGCKHLDVHGGPENVPVNRNSFDSKVSERDWRTTFLPAFRYCARAGVYSMMCSYNSINGVPACANKKLLTDILRKEWGFTGYVISDQVAIEQMVWPRKYVHSNIDAAVAAVDAGVNLELTWGANHNVAFDTIASAVRSGRLSENLLRERVKPLFYTRMRLGEFDPQKYSPYSYITMSVIEGQVHRDYAVSSAMKTFVLLKNDGLLPLQQTIYNKIAIIGPMADVPTALSGDYQTYPDWKFISTPRRGLESLGRHANYAKGCKDTLCNSYDSNSVKNAVQGTDVVFICVGLGTAIETESKDRHDIELPGHQKQMIMDAVAHSGSAKIVLITFNGGPVNIQWADQSNRVNAIIAAFYPGQGTGTALKNVMTTTNKSQFGRLPYTWFVSSNQVPAMVDYSMKGRTYRYFKGEPLYPFGYGLTYTTFHYGNLKMAGSVTAGQQLHGSVDVTNNGNVQADEVVQVYISWAQTAIPAQRRQLVSFERITIPAHGHKTVKFTIEADQMALWIDNNGWKVEAGRINVFVGGQQPNQKKSVGSNIIQSHFDVHGAKLLGSF